VEIYNLGVCLDAILAGRQAPVPGFGPVGLFEE